MPSGGHNAIPYDNDAALHLLEWIAEGKSLKSWCDTSEPATAGGYTIAAVYTWFRKHEEFAKAYAQAREDRADTLVDEMMEIADTASDDAYIKYIDGKPYAAIDGTAIRRADLMIRTRQWVAEKMKPANYGNRIDLTSGGKALGQPFKDTSERLGQILFAALQRQKGDDVPAVTIDVLAEEVVALPAPETPSIDDLLS